MKKILALFIIAAMMICAVSPVSAVERPTITKEEAETIFQAYLQVSYEKHLLAGADLSPPLSLTFDEYAANRSIEKMEAFWYYGRFGKKQYAIVFISSGRIFGICKATIGDYLFNFGHYQADCEYCDLNPYAHANGLYVYSNGELIFLREAYRIGMLTDEDLKEMWNSGVFEDMIWRIGDVDNNKTLDVADIMAIKKLILNPYAPVPSFTVVDFDKSGNINVGDILALKNHIMKTA